MRTRIKVRHFLLAFVGISLLAPGAAAQPARPAPPNRHTQEIEESAAFVVPVIIVAGKVGAKAAAKKIVVKAAAGIFRAYGTRATAKTLQDYLKNRANPVNPMPNPRFPRPGPKPQNPSPKIPGTPIPKPEIAGPNIRNPRIPGVQIPKPGSDITVTSPAPRDLPILNSDVASNATPIVSTGTKERNASGGNPPSEDDPKRRCRYPEWPKTMAYPTAPYILAGKDKMDRLIIRENIGTNEKPASADAAKWSQDAGITLKVIKGPLLGAYLVQLPRKYTASELSRLIFQMFYADATRRPEQKGCRYRYVDPDFPTQIFQEPAEPNDQYFSRQWNLQSKVGEMGARFDGAWREISAWTKRGKSLQPVVIGILDTGFVISPQAGLAFEATGFLPGFNVRNGSSDVECKRPALGCHGTRVASILGARTNNQHAIAGALGVGLEEAWRVGNFRILPVADWVEDNIRAASTFEDSEGLKYAVTKGAKVINMSWGQGEEPCEDLIFDVVKDSLAKGAVLVAASGNRHSSVSLVKAAAPASCPGVIGVVGHEKMGEPSSDIEMGQVRPYFVGKEGSISAPGGNIPTVARYNTAARDWPAVVHTDPDVATSYATPHVTATVAMMISIRPSLTAPEILRILQETGTKPPPSSRRKYPALNAEAAVKAAIYFDRLQQLPPPSPPDSPRPDSPRIERSNTDPIMRGEPKPPPKPSGSGWCGFWCGKR